MFYTQIAYNYFQASWLLLKAATSFFPGAFVVRTRGCTWFVRASNNNCTISPTDKWISRGEARTVGACIEGAGAVPLRPALIPGGRPPPRLIHYLSTKLFRPPVAHNKDLQEDISRREWTIIIEYVSVNGRHLYLLIIFKGKDV